MELDEVTRYLQEMEQGDTSAVDRLLPHVYEDLRRVAGQVFSEQWRNHTLQPTALVHEAYMRMVQPTNASWENRKHFLRVAALAMRQLLTDHARARNAKKREGARNRVSLDEVEHLPED